MTPQTVRPEVMPWKHESTFLAILFVVIGGYSITMELPLITWFLWIVTALCLIDVVHEAWVKVRMLGVR